MLCVVQFSTAAAAATWSTATAAAAAASAATNTAICLNRSSHPTQCPNWIVLPQIYPQYIYLPVGPAIYPSSSAPQRPFCSYRYRLTVIVSDGGGRQTTAVVQGTIIDVNDNSPVFSNVNVIEFVDENLPAGTYITDIVASDSDQAGAAVLVYQILGSERFPFAIDNISGRVTTTRPLDYETETTYSAFMRSRRISRISVNLLCSD